MPTEWIEEIADLFKALAEPTRLLLLLEIEERERTVSELAALSGTSLANASKHLACMKRVGLITRRKSGSHVFYARGDRDILDMVDAAWRRLAGQRDAPSAHREVPANPPLRKGGAGARRAGRPAVHLTEGVTEVEIRQPRLDGLDATCPDRAAAGPPGGVARERSGTGKARTAT